MGLIIVTGPPAAGKSTWVASTAKAGDIVIDYDRLALALTGPDADPHRHPRILRDVTFRARSAAIDEALKHAGDVDVYIIHSLPSDRARERYSDHDATYVEIDPGRDVVMTRIKAMRSRAMTTVAERWYASRGHVPSTAIQASRSW